MKKLILILLITLFSNTHVYSADNKKKCSDLKKFSAAYLTCKTKAIGSGIKNSAKIKKSNKPKSEKERKYLLDHVTDFFKKKN